MLNNDESLKPSHTSLFKCLKMPASLTPLFDDNDGLNGRNKCDQFLQVFEIRRQGRGKVMVLPSHILIRSCEAVESLLSVFHLLLGHICFNQVGLLA